MLMVDIIKKKRDGGALTKEEIDFFVNGYVAGQIPDYQVSALLMAIYFSKMDDKETFLLTDAMLHSGDILNLDDIKGIKVDKHSSGGVGDKTTLVLAPMVASLGVSVAKMSGRGLGHTGGTIDKLESFEGFTTEITNDEFINNVNSIGMAIMGQTKDLAPADKLLYALRDVTGTVDNMSLIASSIMSKKLAAGTDAIVLDVTCGSGAFMKTPEDAAVLARKMVNIGTRSGVEVVAVVSNMDEPLGHAVGNSLEVIEAIDCLNGNGPEDLLELCLTLGSYMVVFAHKADDIETARKMLMETIESKAALNKFAQFIEAQGGKAEDVYNPVNFKKASLSYEVCATKAGYISSINSEEVGITSLILGGGRRSKTDEIDLSVGLILHKKVGDFVKEGEPYVTLYANDTKKLEDAKKRIVDAYEFSDTEVPHQTLIKGIIE